MARDTRPWPGLSSQLFGFEVCIHCLGTCGLGIELGFVIHCHSWSLGHINTVHSSFYLWFLSLLFVVCENLSYSNVFCTHLSLLAVEVIHAKNVTLVIFIYEMLIRMWRVGW